MKFDRVVVGRCGSARGPIAMGLSNTRSRARCSGVSGGAASTIRVMDSLWSIGRRDTPAIRLIARILPNIGGTTSEQRGDTEVVLRMPNGVTEQRSPERAAAMLMKLYRNAIHGFGGRGGRGSNPELDAALLVHHTGKFPDDLALLPYLYLLDFLCHPENIRASIARKVARSS